MEPTVSLNLNTIIQGLMVLALGGIGTAAWAATISIAKIGAAFEEHKKHDEREFDLVRKDVAVISGALWDLKGGTLPTVNGKA